MTIVERNLRILFCDAIGVLLELLSADGEVRVGNGLANIRKKDKSNILFAIRHHWVTLHDLHCSLDGASHGGYEDSRISELVQNRLRFNTLL